MQHGQVLMLKGITSNGEPVWAYRYRTGGRDSRRMQRGGFASEREARLALERELALIRRRQRLWVVTLGELVELYLAQHDAQPETTAKLRWLLDKSVAVFGARPIAELTAPEIAAWRMTIPKGHRFEATQALRQVLAPRPRQPRPLAGAHGRLLQRRRRWTFRGRRRTTNDALGAVDSAEAC